MEVSCTLDQPCAELGLRENPDRAQKPPARPLRLRSLFFGSSRTSIPACLNCVPGPPAAEQPSQGPRKRTTQAWLKGTWQDSANSGCGGERTSWACGWAGDSLLHAQGEGDLVDSRRQQCGAFLGVPNPQDGVLGDGLREGLGAKRCGEENVATEKK